MGLSSEASDEKTVTFMTPPRINAADEIVAKANVVSGNAVNVSWTSPSSLQCVPDYTASICGQDGVCNQVTMVSNPGTGLEMEYLASNLDQCSNYTVRILPKPILPVRHLHPQPILSEPLQATDQSINLG